MICYTNKHKIPFQIDEEDEQRVTSKIWHIAKGYVRSTQGETIRLHQFLMGKAPEGFEWDHINRDKLDNRKENLRLVTHGQNMRNLNLKSNSKSGYQGIYQRESGSYCVMIHFDKQIIHVGNFSCLDQAIQARKEAEEKYWS